MKNNFTIYNYYEELTDKQKEKLNEKKGAVIYYDYYDECRRLSTEQVGVLTLALLHYARTHGTEELPEELANEINKDPLLCYMFETWQKREATATIKWTNQRGGKAKPKEKTKIIELDSEDTFELVGYNLDNMPDSYIDVLLNGEELRNFLTYGNSVKWNKSYTQLLEQWQYIDDDEIAF